MLAPYTSLATPCPKELNIPTAQCFFPNQTLYSESFAPLQRFQYSGKKYIGLFGNKEIDVIYTAEEGRVWRKREEPEEYKNTTNRKLGSTMETVAVRTPQSFGKRVLSTIARSNIIDNTNSSELRAVISLYGLMLTHVHRPFQNPRR